VALKDLIAALEAEVEEKVAHELEAARNEAARIAAESAQLIARRRAELFSAREASIRRELAGELAEAEARVRTDWLAARESVIRKVLDVVRSRLPNLQQDDAYRNAFAGEVADALSYVEARDVIIRCAPGIAPHMARLLEGRSWMRIENDASISAGFRVIAENGRVEVDKTLDTRLRRLEPQLRIEIVRRLETELPGPGQKGNANAVG
jgi:vacuolar-type H+-ATPase subunit E/Vma4